MVRLLRDTSCLVQSHPLFSDENFKTSKQSWSTSERSTLKRCFISFKMQHTACVTSKYLCRNRSGIPLRGPCDEFQLSISAPFILASIKSAKKSPNVAGAVKWESILFDHVLPRKLFKFSGFITCFPIFVFLIASIRKIFNA